MPQKLVWPLQSQLFNSDIRCGNEISLWKTSYAASAFLTPLRLVKLAYFHFSSIGVLILTIQLSFLDRKKELESLKSIEEIIIGVFFIFFEVMSNSPIPLFFLSPLS